MSRRHRPSKADRKPVTRRYMARLFGRLRDDLVHAVIFAEAAQVPEPPFAFHNIEPVPAERMARLFGTTKES